MLVSWNWLSEFVSCPRDVEKFAERMTFTGSEIEEIREPWKDLQGVMVARIASLEPHEENDAWKKVALDAGGTSWLCITAAKNVREGDMVPYAPPGAVLADGTTLEEKYFGSVLSQGMLLSAQELGLEGLQEEEGILILPQEAPLGEDVKKYLDLDDVIFDVAITPNRGDLLSMAGMAREAYGVLPEAELHLPVPPSPSEEKEWPFFFKGISRNDHLCPFFALALMSDITIAPSPIEAKILLLKHGIRPISNVVDATNLAMLAQGQPLHAYDASLLPEKEITVRAAFDGERLKTLDGKERGLSPDDLCITSKGMPIGLAGVMGGEDTEIHEGTSTILLESALFNREMVGATSRRMGLHSEASYRNARGVNREKALLGLYYCLNLLSKWKAGTGGYTILRSGNPVSEPPEIELTNAKMERILLHQRMEDAREILERLGFEEIERREDLRRYRAPKERLDMAIEEDLIEEVGRVEGYNHIPSRIPSNLHAPGNMTPEMHQVGRFREIAMGRGYSEAITYSFVSPDMLKALSFPEEDRRKHPIMVLNPISRELSCMRTLLLPGLLQSVVGNIRSGWKDPIHLFESGRVFLKEETGHVEPPLMGGIVYAGKRKNLLSFQEDFFRVKGDVEALCASAGAEVSFLQAEEPFGHKGQTAHIYLGNRCIGYLARLKPSLEDAFDLGAPVYAFEIEIASLLDVPSREYGESAKYPGIYRDISLLVDARNSSALEVERKIADLMGEYARSVMLFDVYQGKGVPEDKRSLSFSVLYRHESRTLNDDEVDAQHVALRSALESLGYVLR